MVVLESVVEAGTPAAAVLVLPYELRCKSRLRTRLADGEEAGVFLAPGTVLRDGMLLASADGRVVEVRAAEEPLLEARCPDPLALARAAYHLGNRHVAVQVGEGWLRLQPDHVLAGMLEGLGVRTERVVAPFDPEAGAYAPGHTHGGAGTPARIHHFGAGARDAR